MLPRRQADLTGRLALKGFDRTGKMEGIFKPALVGDFGNRESRFAKHRDASFGTQLPEEPTRRGLQRCPKPSRQDIARTAGRQRGAAQTVLVSEALAHKSNRAVHGFVAVLIGLPPLRDVEKFPK